MDRNGDRVRGGLALIFLGKRPLYALAGILLLVLPHLIGAPQPEAHGGSAPAALAQSFVATAIVTSFLFWVPKIDSRLSVQQARCQKSLTGL